VELGAGLDRAPFGQERFEAGRACRRVVDAGATGQQVMDGGSALARQQALDVVDAEVFEGAVQGDDAVGDGASVEEGEDAFADGSQVADFGGVAVLEDGIAALDGQ
jgi:hypothetical protein